MRDLGWAHLMLRTLCTGPGCPLCAHEDEIAAAVGRVFDATPLYGVRTSVPEE